MFGRDLKYYNYNQDVLHTQRVEHATNALHALDDDLKSRVKTFTLEWDWDTDGNYAVPNIKIEFYPE